MIEFAGYLEAASVAPIFLLAPTSTQERVQKVAKIARGYVYYVSLKGVTGSGAIDIADVEQRLASIRQHLGVPVGVGFCIRDAESARRLGQVSDAVIIGSKLIETMEEAGAAAAVAGKDPDTAAVQAAKLWLAGVRQALN